MIKDLHLKWTELPAKEFPGQGYFDFIVSGQSLREYLGLKNNLDVTAFGFFSYGEQQKVALREFRLQQKRQLPGDRIELYMCPCGGFGCGTITAKIIDNGDKIIWTAFANQSDEDEFREVYHVADLEFDRQNYFKAFSSIK